MEDMNVLVYLFFGMVACFCAFVAGLFHARATGIDDRAAVVVAGAWAAVVAGVGAALLSGNVLIAALSVVWLFTVRALAGARADRARRAAVLLAVITLVAIGAA